MKDERYFNFPVQLLKGYFKTPNVVLSNIVDYAFYAHTMNYNYDNGYESLMTTAEKYFKVTLYDKLSCYKNGEILFNKTPKSCPKVGIKTPILWDYHDNDKTDFEHACLLGFLAIKSIVQDKAYCKIDNKFWLSRMDGRARSVDDISKLSPDIRQYANEYQTKKIKTELRDNWGLITYSRYTRGFYVSFKLDLEQLIYEAEKRRKSTLQKQADFEKREAYKRVMKRLNG